MKITEYNQETKTTIERDATPEEIEQREKDVAKDKADLLAREAEAKAKATAKAALLDRLGITAEEAVLLLS
jgi:hypothetical protein